MTPVRVGPAAPLAALVALTLGCISTEAPSRASIDACVRRHPAPAVDVIVRRDATGTLLAGDQFYEARGVGSYPLLEHAGTGHMELVNEILDTAVALGRPVVRTNAFFDGGSSPARIRNDDGSVREDGLVGLDRLLAAAREHGVRLVLVLTNHWADYGGAAAVLRAVAPGEELPAAAFYSDPRAIAAQRAYIRVLLARVNTVTGVRYAQDPFVLAWELANEPRCDEPAYCETDVLTPWARTMATELRDAGAEQLVAWGGSGGLDEGENGESLERIAADGAVDIVTLHLYPQLRSAVAVAGVPGAERPVVAARWGAERLREAAAIARGHGRALFVEELGWAPIGGDDADGERALVLGAWLRAARQEHVHAMPWMIAERGRPDYDGLLIRAFDDAATTEALACE